MMRFSRKHILALGIVCAFGVGLSVPRAWADDRFREPSSDIFYASTKEIVVAAEFAMTPSVNKEIGDETNKIFKLHPYLTLDKIQQAAFNYVQDNIDRRLKNCIRVRSASRDKPYDYSVDYSNLILMVGIDVNTVNIDGKEKHLLSLYLRTWRYPDKSYDSGAFRLTSAYNLPTQAIYLGNDPKQFDKDLDAAIARLFDYSMHFYRNGTCREQ